MEKQKNEEFFVLSKEGYKAFKLLRSDKELIVEVKSNSRNEKIPNKICVLAIDVIDQIIVQMNYEERMKAYHMLGEKIKESKG